MQKHLLCIILVILLFILIFVEKENLKNVSKYKEYRLGDLVKGYFVRTVDRKKIFKNYPRIFPDTIASRYIKEIKNLPDNQKWNNIGILDKLTKSEEIIDAALHLRLGDIISDYQKKTNTFKNGHQGKNVYFYQPYVYDKIIKELKNKGVKKIHIFYGSHNIWDSNSSKYVKIIKDIIFKNNIRIIDKKTGNPDKDFIEMSNAKIFIKSGGGFSRLIARLAKRRNSIVISPENYL